MPSDTNTKMQPGGLRQKGRARLELREREVVDRERTTVRCESLRKRKRLRCLEKNLSLERCRSWEQELVGGQVLYQLDVQVRLRIILSEAGQREYLRLLQEGKRILVPLLKSLYGHVLSGALWAKW